MSQSISNRVSTSSTYWRSMRLGDITDIRTGPFGSALHQSDYQLFGTPIVTVEHLSDNGLLHRNLPLVGDEDAKRLASYRCRQGDILFSRVGSIDRSSIVSGREDGWLFSGRLLRIRVTDSSIDPWFLSYLLSGTDFRNQVRSVAVGQTMPSLNTSLIADLVVNIPSIKDQKRIAQQLGDANALLIDLERLLAKKRGIKRGMMQELLTGNTRLPGFSGKWKLVPLGQIAEFHRGFGLSKSDLSIQGKLPCIHYGELFTKYGAQIVSVSSRTSRNDLPVRSCAGDVLMPTSDVTPRGLAKASAVLEKDVVIGGDILIIKPIQSLAFGTFLAYSIRHDAEQVLSLVKGITVFHLHASDMHNFSLHLPSLEEQEAICSVLNQAQSELDELEQYLVKVRYLKQGMRQELLTGRTRLV